MVNYKLKFYSIKKNKDELKQFDSFDDFIALYKILLGHTYIKDLKAYKYNKASRLYKEFVPNEN